MNYTIHNGRRPRLTIRIGQASLAFALPDEESEHQVIYMPYTVRSGVSIAANLREAFKTEELLTDEWTRAQVMLDTPVVMIPLEDYYEQDQERNSTYYHHAITGHANDIVLDDHFSDVRFMPVAQPVWNHLYRRSFTGVRRKLYGYFHDKRLEVFSFQQSRFQFCNSFEVTSAHDSVFFLLSVWKQLGLDQRKDELHLVGNIPEKETFLSEVRRFVQNAYVINPTADFNRAPVSSIKGMPYDLMTLFVKGR